MISLQKDPSRDFVVLNITDPQLDKSYLPEDSADRRHLFMTVERIIRKSDPDLITVSGDFCYGDSPYYGEVCRLFGAYLESFGIPWAIVWGNHDHQGNDAGIRQVLEIYRTFPHFLFEEGPGKLGNGNYVISIEENGIPVEGILMMDTHDRVPYTSAAGEKTEVWAKLTPAQLDWYRDAILSLKARGCPASCMISHIPIFAYREAFHAAFRSDLDPKAVSVEESYRGSCWNEGYKDSFGVMYEYPCTYPEDEGAFRLISELDHTKVLLCGHDHVNCWRVLYQGIQFVYSLKTGRGCYYHEGLNGGTVLKIHRDGAVDVSHIFAASEALS